MDIIRTIEEGADVQNYSEDLDAKVEYQPSKRVKYDGPGGRSPVPEHTFVFNKDITDGAIMTDMRKNKWRVGKPLGQGNFGEIFLASNNIKRAVTSVNAKYVVKIERHRSGTLFAEIHCLMNAGRSTEEAPLPPGITEYVASGSHTFNKIRYRFLVLPRYKFDLQSVIKSHCFEETNLLVTAIQTLDVLQHLHGKGYVHCDIKAANMMIGSGPKTPIIQAADDDEEIDYSDEIRKSSGTRADYSEANSDYNKMYIRKRSNVQHKPAQSADGNDRIFLIDFGLALKYRSSIGTHKPFCVDKLRSHDGTLEFTSRDAHMGAHSRRSDLECLGYNLIFWSQGWLPWDNEKLVSHAEQVHRIKEHFMSDIKEMLKQVYGEEVPKYLGDFLVYVNGLAFTATPDYDFCRNIFLSALHQLNVKAKDMKIDVNRLKSSPRCTVKDKLIQRKRNKIVKEILRTNGLPKNLRSKSDKIAKKFSWTDVLNSNPDKIDKHRAKNVPTVTPLVVKYAGKPNNVIMELENRLKFKDRFLPLQRDDDKKVNGIGDGADNKSSGDGKSGDDASSIDASDWCTDQVYKYFENIFPRHAHVFIDHEIDGPSLYLLRRDDILHHLGLAIGPALNIYNHILKLQTKNNDQTLTRH